MKKMILLLTVFLAGLTYAAAQKVSVTGVVSSQEDGLPVIGASVIEKGTPNGAITDLDGKYSLSVPVGAILEFTYLGMTPQSRKINEAGRVDIVLIPDAVAINEVVVTAMGVKTEKKRLNFAVQSVNADDLTDKKATNFVNALQGKIAGLSVTTSG
ncbi:MAG: carboxypeptidase-like regulatory domain-containing protein, partial [Dysgonamonadaceae bacterium]|nr:carboxypeptidase-like regulatory domain-containing protein [Dysgonamonadaceae bacterium]